MTRLYQQDLFYTSFPPYMACSDDFGNVVHLPKDDALEKPYIAPNNKAFINCLLFDIDRPEAGAAWIDADLPQPNWTVQNPNNGHVHLGYWLKTPVSRTLASRADRKSTRLNSSHVRISYAVFCLKKKKKKTEIIHGRSGRERVDLAFDDGPCAAGAHQCSCCGGSHVAAAGCAGTRAGGDAISPSY